MSNIKNYYELVKHKKIRNPGFKNHGLEIPFYALIIGSSGSGKTNILLQFLSASSDTFTKIVICLKNKDEPLYNLLDENVIEFYEEGEIPDITDFNNSKMSLIVFDDLVLSKDQSKIQEYFIRARKMNISCIYLSQSYYRIPKLIRINARYIIIKKLASQKDLNLVVSEYSLGNKDEILKIYQNATKQFTDFLLIDTFNNSFKMNF
jgi:hypothetical protein